MNFEIKYSKYKSKYLEMQKGGSLGEQTIPVASGINSFSFDISICSFQSYFNQI